MNREQKRILGDAVWTEAIKLVEFFGEIHPTDELEKQGVTPEMVREQLAMWLGNLPSQYGNKK